MSTTTQHQPRSNASSLLRRHPLAVFFSLTYVAAWLLWAPLVIFRDSMPGGVGFILALLGTLVPSTVAVVLVGKLHGKPGVRRLFGRLLMGRVGIRWYVALALVPMIGLLALGLSVLLGGSTEEMNTTVIAVLVGLVFSIFPGSAMGEELGWRGFALPGLQAKHSALSASLLIGPVWGLWHLPLWLTGRESHPISLFPVFVVSVITLSVLCTWMYNGTGGSLLLVVLLHATANLPLTFVITPLGKDMTQIFLIFVALMVVAATVVVVATGPANLSRTRQKQVAMP
ncbi:MAG TPA: type II CAAX endopeptidase family protein [Kribbella sp.]|nr:type II CAAX endopeptidase family protein [Kribbella sp.]